MSRGLSDPSWKKGPKTPSPTDSEHAIHPEDFGLDDADWDGFGVDEDEMTEGEPLVALQERVVCARKGCDASHKRRILFTTETLSEEEERALRAVSQPDRPGVYVLEHGERVGPETISINGTQIVAETTIENEATGPCYGHEEPDPEPYGL